MNLYDLVVMFRGGKAFSEFCKDQGLDVQSEVIEIYAQEPITQESSLGFFPIEKTSGRVEISFDGKKFHNLFDFFYFLDVIKASEGKGDLSDAALANRLFVYATKDA